MGYVAKTAFVTMKPRYCFLTRYGVFFIRLFIFCHEEIFPRSTANVFVSFTRLPCCTTNYHFLAMLSPNPKNRPWFDSCLARSRRWYLPCSGGQVEDTLWHSFINVPTPRFYNFKNVENCNENTRVLWRKHRFFPGVLIVSTTNANFSSPVFLIKTNSSSIHFEITDNESIKYTRARVIITLQLQIQKPYSPYNNMYYFYNKYAIYFR